MSWVEPLATLKGILTISLLLALLLSKKYRVLRLTQLYLFIPVFIGFFYNGIFIYWRDDYFNWYFYYFMVSVEAGLFALCFWEMYKFYTGTSLSQVWITIVAVLLLPLIPIPFIYKLSTPFLLVNLFIVLQSGKIFEIRKPMLYLILIANAMAITLDGLKLITQYDGILKVVKTLDAVVPVIMLAGMLTVVIWQPVTRWFYLKLRNRRLGKTSDVSYAPVGKRSGTITNFPESQFEHEPVLSEDELKILHTDVEKLEPLISSAERMIILTKKPFLNSTELAQYCGIDPSAVASYLEKHSIHKIFLSDDSNEWVVNRFAVDCILDGELSDDPQ